MLMGMGKHERQVHKWIWNKLSPMYLLARYTYKQCTNKMNKRVLLHN